MHEGEIHTDVALARRLVARQFPQWAHLPVTAVPIGGTDHALYRLGEELVIRLPRIGWAVDQVDSDCRWLPALAPHLPLAVPVPVAIGAPDEGYPWPWSVVPWLPGENPTSNTVDLDLAAVQLAEFVTALQQVDTTGGPLSTGTRRGAPLAALDVSVRAAIAELGERVDAAAVTAAWEAALSASPWRRSPLWIHGDLQTGNLLVHQRRLTAVIDFGGLGVGDPAVDLIAAWAVFDKRSRETFRDALDCDDDTWQRSKGWALSTALIALPYYWRTAPAIVAESQRKIAAVLGEPR